MNFAEVNENVSNALKNSNSDLNAETQKLSEKISRAENLLEKLRRRPPKLIGKNFNWAGENLKLNAADIWLCQVDEITFTDKAPQKEGVENILGTFRGLKEFNFIYLILGDGQRIRFFFGVVKNKISDAPSKFQVSEIGEKLLKPAIEGNFRGCKLQVVTDENFSHDNFCKEEIFKIFNDENFTGGIIEGVPSSDFQKNISEGKKENFQSVDRLTDVMQGCKFGLAVIANPCSSKTADNLSRNLYAAYDILNALKITAQHSKNFNLSSNVNSTAGKNIQHSNSTQDSETDNFTYTESSAFDIRNDISNQISKSSGETVTDNTSRSKSYDYSKDTGNGGKDRETTHDSADVQSKSAQNSAGKNYNFNVTENKSSGKSENKQHSDSKNFTKSYNKSVLENKQFVNTQANSITLGTSRQLETEPKFASDWLKYIDEVLLPRLDSCNGKGIFNVCTYVFAENEIAFKRLANTAVSLFTGSKGNKSALRVIQLDKSSADGGCKNALKNFQIPAAKIEINDTTYETLTTRITDGQNLIFGGNWMSTNELVLMTGFPQREIIGLKLREEVEFGLNSIFIESANRIELGKMIQCGKVLDNVKIALDKTQLDKHTFISGVTGSGKTTTCQNILIGCELPFLVIEPAKTEYRALKTNYGEIIYFTPGKQSIAPFFLNPFELFPGEEISSRADMLTATFESSFEMEAAIPQIMNSAIYKAYRNKGWNIANSTWKNKNPFAAGVYAFPTLSDFKNAVKSVIFSQGFDDRLRDEYLGSINARIESLMNGAKGQMLNTPRSIDFADLVRRQVVIELEEIKSSAEKSFLMGLILTNLMQAVKQVKRQDKNFRHITLIEEAHRLLSRYTPGDNRNRKQGVEVFADMLAEVRKYGEALIIADQIPDKMTPEVLKNTSTKIVHKLFAKDDKDAIGNAISLTNEQKNFLSNLQTGRAVVFSQGWDKAVQVKIDMKTSTAANDIEESEIHSRSLKYYSLPEIARRGVIPLLDKISDLNPATADKFLWLHSQSYIWANELKSLVIDNLSEVAPPEDLTSRQIEIATGIKETLAKIEENFLVKYFELKMQDLIFDAAGFRLQIENLFSKIKNSSSNENFVDAIKIFISQVNLNDFCKLPN